MARIQVIDHSEAEGRLKEIYDDLLNRRGKLAEVHKIQSLRPESIVHHMDLYMEIMYSKSELTRAEREMMGVVVSAANGCSYCVKHHSQAVLPYWKDQHKVEGLADNYRQLSLNEREEKLLAFIF